MEGIRYFTPNRQAQPAFAQALERAEAAGVGLYAYGCHVTRDSMQISYEIPVILNPDKEQDGLETIAAPLLNGMMKTGVSFHGGRIPHPTGYGFRRLCFSRPVWRL